MLLFQQRKLQVSSPAAETIDQRKRKEVAIMEDNTEDDKEVEVIADAPKEQREQKQALDKVGANLAEEKELDTTKAQKVCS